MNDCIFCKIARGEISCFQLYEDDLVKAFLDINPTSKGHILVVPKEHYENVFGVPDECLSRISKVCKEMSILCKEKLSATGVNILNASGKDAQQSFFHLHFHVVPRYENDGLDLGFFGKKGNASELKEILKKLLV
ncbi:MAG: HIT family protein [Candidatus Nanoarchaeia archaeon]